MTRDPQSPPTPAPDEGFIDRDLFPGTFGFVIGYQEHPSFIEDLVPYREYIDSIYLPLPPQYMGSGKPWTEGDPAEWERTLPARIRSMKDRGIEPEIACNDVLPDASRLDELLRYLGRLVDAGLKLVTVAYLPLAAEIHRRIPELEIRASTIAFIADPSRLERWLELANVRSVVPDVSVNKDIATLRRLKRYGVDLVLVLDDICLPNCPVQFQHYYLLSRCGERPGPAVKEGLAGIDEQCCAYRRDQSWQMYKMYIVPADLPHYAGVVRGLKLGRGQTGAAAHVIREMRHHMDTRVRTHFYHGYYEPPEAWDRVNTCDRVCRECMWCKDALEEHNLPTEARDNEGAPLWRPKDPDKASPYRP